MIMKNNQSRQNELESDYRVTFQQWVSAQEEIRSNAGNSQSEAARSTAQVLASTASSRYQKARNRFVDERSGGADSL